MAVAEKPLYYFTIHEAQQLIHARKLSPVELTQAVLDRIAAVDGTLHAYINLMSDSALREARSAEAEIAKGNWRGAMHGIPVAVKDQLDVAGARGAHSPIHQGRGRRNACAQTARSRRGLDGQAAYEQPAGCRLAAAA